MSDPSERLDGLRAGADEILVKPFDRLELLARVSSLLGLRSKEAVLVQRNIDLLEMQRGRDDMAVMIVHDLKNPMAVILANLSVLQGSANKFDSDETEALADCLTAGRRMQRLLANLLDQARLEATELELHRESVRLVRLLQPSFGQRSFILRSRNITATLDVPEELEIECDGDLLVRVIENILDNAIRYTPVGGRLEVAVEPAGRYVSVRVGNSGPPIPMEAHQRIFDKYAQVSPPSYGNAGLGLYFCRLVVEAHGGRLEIEESERLPVVFHMMLPLDGRQLHLEQRGTTAPADRCYSAGLMRPISDVAEALGFSKDQIIPWGPDVAKLDASVVFPTHPATPRGKLVLVTAISPTPAGEGKTTTTIGITQAARKNGVHAVCALREPSLGPIFGVKGGGTGGGKSMLQPSDRINLHFTGDLHAITSAHNLLAAAADVDLYFGQPPKLDGRQMTFRRALDMNDRFLRKIVIGLGGKAMGTPREDGFDITAASEVMAILCLAKDWADLKTRLGNILVGFGRDGSPVYARDLETHGAMAALLRDALLPNLVQTTDGSPALVHGGPFANIAHGCNSIVATRVALERADIVFTEAGFGCDLGAEKFLDIKCRTAGIFPSAVVLVATLRALKFHGGVAAAASGAPDMGALRKGIENLEKHVESIRAFGIEPVVALNFRTGDPKEELDWVQAHCKALDVDSSVADVYGLGGAGAVELADIVVKKVQAATPKPCFMYELADSPQEKMCKVARTMYGADDVDFAPAAIASIDRAVKLGFGELPICVAKTHLSLSDDAKKVGRPRGFRMTVREARLSAGAGFLVMLTGEIFTMPGLPKVPHATKIDLSANGTITGIV